MTKTAVKPAAPTVAFSDVKPSDPPQEFKWDGLPKSIDAPVTYRAVADPLEDTPSFIRERLSDALSAGKTGPDGKFVPAWKIQSLHSAEQAAEFVRLAKRYGRAADKTVQAFQGTYVDGKFKPNEEGKAVRYTMRPAIKRARS